MRHRQPKPPTREEIETARLERIGALAGEHFTDFLLVVRVAGGVRWKNSDRAWALGAAKRFNICMDEDDRERRRDLHAGSGE